MINVLYFASFRETLGRAHEQINAEVHSVEDLLTSFAERGEVWTQTLCENKNLQIAVNHDVAQRHTPLKPGDEVAFFPPVTGG